MRIRTLTVAVIAATAATLAFAVASSTGQGGGTQNVTFAKLDGKSEVSESGKTGAGDTDGIGTFSWVVSGDKLCSSITVDKLDTPTGAHIHRGAKGKNGPIVVTLKAPSKGSRSFGSKCITVKQDLLDEFRDNPGAFYVNVHTGKFPAGAIRGQIFKR